MRWCSTSLCLAARMPIAPLESRPGPLERTAGVRSGCAAPPRELDAPPRLCRRRSVPGHEYRLWRREPAAPGVLHADLACAASPPRARPGAPKLDAWLSMRNLESNCGRDPGRYLEARPGRARRSEPARLHLFLRALGAPIRTWRRSGSLVLARGLAPAPRVLGDRGWSIAPRSRAFPTCTRPCGGCASIPTVPRPAHHPGGRGCVDHSAFHGLCTAAGAPFFVMYGERAAARIAYVPPGALGKIGAIRIAIPGGDSPGGGWL